MPIYGHAKRTRIIIKQSFDVTKRTCLEAQIDGKKANKINNLTSIRPLPGYFVPNYAAIIAGCLWCKKDKWWSFLVHSTCNVFFFGALSNLIYYLLYGNL